jgi:internalin A
MKTRHFIPALVTAVMIAGAFGCNDRGATEPTPIDTTHGGPVVYKPNIYLYPTTAQQISVRLLFPVGGRVIESAPAYGSGWLVDVEPSGRINQQYDYLFYEAQTPDRYQFESGWIVQRDTVAEFFRHALTNAGFEGREISDFLEYWAPRLQSNEHYTVFPQQTELLDNLIALDVVPKPHTALRLFFVIRSARVSDVGLHEPTLHTIERGGFVLAEWGVVLQ